MNSPLPPALQSKLVSSMNVSQRARAAAAECGRIWAEGGIPSPSQIWSAYSPEGEVDILSAILKVDIQVRYSRGERPSVADYLHQFSPLRAARDRVVSLVYEEYCLREEAGEQPNPESFCARYDPWKDSLLSQLRYHHVLSQAIGIEPGSRSLPAPGDRFRGFFIQSVLGRGGSATVFFAIEENVGRRPIALKLSMDRGSEASIHGTLNHDHIVPVLSVTDDPETGLRGLAMPYRAGFPLDEVIRLVDPASRPKSAKALRSVLEKAPQLYEDHDSDAESSDRWRDFPAEGTYAQGVAWVVSVVARALAYAHARGVLHRDVKPANVLLTIRGGPQLLDFNLSHSPHAADQAEAALRGGTLPYMAPEQLAAFLDPKGWDSVNESADIYALGLLLRELLTGRRPDSHDPSAHLPRAIADLLEQRALGFSTARSHNPDVPHGLDAIIARCLANRPQDRYSNAKALAEDLQRFVDRRPLVEAKNPSIRERVSNFAFRRRKLFAGVGVVILAASIATPFLLNSVAASNRKAAASAVSDAIGYIDRGRVSEAATEVALAKKLDPNLYSAFWTSARLNVIRQKPSDAWEDIQRAVMLASKPGLNIEADKMAGLYLDQGKIAFRLDKDREAEKAYYRALAFNPECYPVFDGLGMIRQNEKRFEAAIHFTTQAIAPLEAMSKRSLDSNKSLAQFYSHRAIGLIGCGGVQQDKGRGLEFKQAKPFFDEAKPLYDAARRDISVARELKVELSTYDAAMLDFAEVCALMAEGDLESLPDHHTEALTCYEAADKLLQNVKGKLPDRFLGAYPKELEQRIKGTRKMLGK